MRMTGKEDTLATKILVKPSISVLNVDRHFIPKRLCEHLWQKQEATEIVGG